MATFLDYLLKVIPKAHPMHMKLAEATVFDVTNVARYWFDVCQKEEIGLNADFPSIVPPLPLMFMEYKAPQSFIERALRSDRDQSAPNFESQVRSVVGMGFLVETREVAVGETVDWNGYALEGARWIVSVTHFINMGKHQPSHPIMTMRFPIDADGRWLSLRKDSIVVWYVPESTMKEYLLHVNPMEVSSLIQMMGEDTSAAFVPCLFALSFMHCKNVTVLEQRPEDWQQKVAMKKKGDRPLITYHVLNIEPMKTVLRTEGDIEHNGIKKALHICRGHFKTFTADKPLFGRVTGTYWWHSQVRGSSEVGVALKDYNVRPPRQTPD